MFRTEITGPQPLGKLNRRVRAQPSLGDTRGLFCGEWPTEPGKLRWWLAQQPTRFTLATKKNRCFVGPNRYDFLSRRITKLTLNHVGRTWVWKFGSPIRLY